MESHAAQVIVAIIPIVGIVIGGVVVFFYLLWRHKHISMMIRTGTYKPVYFNFKLFSLLAGLLLAGVGLVLTILLGLLEGLSYPLLGGLIPGILGLMLLVFYKLYPSSNEKTIE